MLRSFINHATRRILTRSETSVESAGSKVLTPKFTPAEPLKFPLQDIHVTTPTGIMPPIGNTASLPFKISRTNTGQLPVYTDIRNGRTNFLTIVRRCSGDLAELQGELERLTGSAVVQKTNALEIKGMHSRKVKLWLKHLGY